jgi:molybdopterin/thiamine biosynthesis adenylyltransferase/rhodanese-related sulfurtransferase
MMPALFSQNELKRYSRHFLLPELGEKAQLKLKSARVLCVGLGGLGSPAATYLAAAGVGSLGIIDFDRVDLSNLQRQTLFSTSDVGGLKTESAQTRLNALNPEVRIELHSFVLDKTNILDLFKKYDLILDGTDNYQARYLINDACCILGKPNVSASVFRFEGQLSLFSAENGPCYRCLYPTPPPQALVPACAEAGVLGVVPGILGTLQAAEVIKYLTGTGRSLIGRLLMVDVLSMEFRSFGFAKNPQCMTCGTHASQELMSYEEVCQPQQTREIAAIDLKSLLQKGEKLLLLDVRDPSEHAAGFIPGAMLISLPELKNRSQEFQQREELVVTYCKSGKRSQLAAETLRGLGFMNVMSLKGGILGWFEDFSE